MELVAIVSFLPIAVKTWDGARIPAVHALPEDAHIPFISNIKTKDSESIPSIQKLTFEHSLSFLSPFKITPSIPLSISFINSSLIFFTLSLCSIIFEVAISIAFPSPTIPGTFSVPALFEHYWCPPFITGSNFTKLLIYAAPTPFGP